MAAKSFLFMYISTKSKSNEHLCPGHVFFVVIFFRLRTLYFGENMEASFHKNPYRFILIFMVLSICMLFLVLSFAYTFSTFNRNFHFTLPVIFHANTLIILLSSFTFRQAMLNLKSENMDSFLKQLILTAGLGIAFLVFQIDGWFELFQKGNGLSQTLTGDYLTAISFLHLLHITGGIIPLVICACLAYQRKKDPVKLLIFQSNSSAIFRLQVLEIYWHFIDALWVYLYVLFITGIYLINSKSFFGT